MSTSTVSRADEVNRMRDIEDSFEDRYARQKNNENLFFIEK